MNISAALTALAHDQRVVWALVLVAVDLVLGVLAAAKLGQFALAKVAAFARDDLLFKLAPWAVLYVASKLAPGGDHWLNLDVVQNTVYGLVAAAWAASIVTSLHQLGFGAVAGLARITGSEHGQGPPAVP